ncbi:MAG TPA: GlsB/YeaQ/YmgE family stress response membrane protein [Pirellulales bacterium]|nr:GlsB/YeaQ/YmgE family stress response membrane protein [Pirellulales bacterium]
MEIISWLIFGFFAGLIARLFFPEPTDFRGCLPTIALGMLGAVVGGLIGKQLEISGWRFVLSIIGAILVLVIYRALFGARRI